MSSLRGRRAVLVLGLGAAAASAALVAANRQNCRALWYVLQLEVGGIDTKTAAAAELGDCPAAFAVGPLLDAASENEPLRPVAVESLVRIGRPGIPRLLEGLRAEGQNRRRVAALALRRLELEREARIEVEAWFAANGTEEEKAQSFQAFADIDALPDPVIFQLTVELARAGSRHRVLPYLIAALGRQGPRAAAALPLLIAGLDSGNSNECQRAVVGIGEAATLPLAQELALGDGEHRRRAAEALRGLGPLARAAVPRLIGALDDPEPRVRKTVEAALGAIGPEAREAIPRLTALLDDPDEETSVEAASALSGIASESVPALLNLLETGDGQQRRLALSALEGMGVEALGAGEALRGALGDEDPEIRTRAAIALFGLNERPEDLLAPLLEGALEPHDSRVSRRARAALAALGARAMPLASRLTALLHEGGYGHWVLPILVRLSESSEVLFQTLESESEENFYDLDLAAAVLQLRRTPKSVERFLRYLSSPQRAVQTTALEKIGEMRLEIPEIAEKVASILDEPEALRGAGKDAWPGDDLFPAAARAMEGLGSEAARAARRLKQIRSTGSTSVRLWAATVLFRIEGRPDGALPVALEALKGDARIEAIRLVGSIGPAAREAEAALRAALMSPSRRPAAACALWRITGNHADALEVLLGGLERPQVGGLESWLLQFGEDYEPKDRILAEMGRPALEALLRLLEHRFYDVRIAACHALASMGAGALPGVPALCARLRDPHLPAADAALKAIAKLRPADLAPLEALLADGDARVALRAAFLLGRLRREEAIPKLEGLLSRDDTRAPAAFLLGTLEPARRAPAPPIPDRRPRETVDALLPRLCGPDPVAAKKAAEDLGRLGPEAAALVPLLAKALDRDQGSVEHVRALGKIRSDAPRSVPALLRVLERKEDSASYQRAAEVALSAFGNEVVPFVVEELRRARKKTRAKLLHSWIGILERCGPAAAPAVPDLIALLGHEYHGYRELAAEALGAIGPAAGDAAPHLEKILGDREEFTSVLNAAWRALKKIRSAPR